MTILQFPSDATADSKRGVQANVYYWGDRCYKAEAENTRLRDLLSRGLKSVEGGKWRDSAGLSAEAHPVWDDVRGALKDQPSGRS